MAESTHEGIEIGEQQMLRALSIFILLNISSAVFAQPNIVFIFADDLGVGDVAGYGGAT